MSIAQSIQEPSDTGAGRQSPTASASHSGAVIIDRAGLACSESAAAVHKHPFAPIQLDEEPTHKNMFRHACHVHDCPKGSRHKSQAVRVFIGPTSASWMQGHKRWWTKTAEKLEGKASGDNSSSKIRRRASSSRSADRDNTSDIFNIATRRGSEDSLSSSCSTYSSSSSLKTSGSRRSSDAQSSNWSAHSGNDDRSDSDGKINSPKNQTSR
ncbi:hypothetical protein IWW38_004541, partial [Coemansia aciculifera]